MLENMLRTDAVVLFCLHRSSRATHKGLNRPICMATPLEYTIWVHCKTKYLGWVKPEPIWYECGSHTHDAFCIQSNSQTEFWFVRVVGYIWYIKIKLRFPIYYWVEFGQMLIPVLANQSGNRPHIIPQCTPSPQFRFYRWNGIVAGLHSLLSVLEPRSYFMFSHSSTDNFSISLPCWGFWKT